MEILGLRPQVLLPRWNRTRSRRLCSRFYSAFEYTPRNPRVAVYGCWKPGHANARYEEYGVWHEISQL